VTVVSLSGFRITSMAVIRPASMVNAMTVEPFARGQVHPVLRSAAAQCPDVMPAPAEFRKDQAAQRPGPANDCCLHTPVTTQPAAV